MADSNPTPSLTDRFVPPSGFSVKWLQTFDPRAAREHNALHDAPTFDLGDRVELGDRAANGAGLRVRFGRVGDIVFVRYLNNPTRQKVTLGTWSASKQNGRLTLEQAREWSDRIFKAAKQGRLEEEKEELRKALTAHIKQPEPGPWQSALVKDVEAEWYRACIEPKWDGARLLKGRRETAGVDLSMRLMLEEIGNRHIINVQVLELNKIVQRVVDRGTRGTARQLLAHIKQFFRWAKAHGYFDPPPSTGIRPYENPADPMTAEHFKLRPTKRKRVAAEDEIRAVWFLGEQHVRRGGRPVSRSVCLGLRLLLLTGLRTQELRLNRWENVIWDGETKDGIAGPALIVPVALQKGDQEQRDAARDWAVPLAPAALAILRLMHAAAKGSPWIIPAVYYQGKIPLSHSSMSRALKRRGLTDSKMTDPRRANLRTHDLRRTFRTGISRLTSAAIAERCLNHVLPDMQAVYDQHDYLGERREALEKWADHVMSIVYPDGGAQAGDGQVLPLVRAVK